MAKRHGVVVKVIPETEDGDISIPHLEEMLKTEVTLFFSFVCSAEALLA